MMDDEEVRAPTLTSSTGVELEIDSTSVGNKNVSSDENYSLSVVTSRLEQEEIEYLRMENALLKKKIKKFERARLLGHIAPSSSLSSVCSVSSSCSLATEENELEKVNALLEKAKEAKQEALTYVQNTSREKLGKEVQVLSSILQKAKMERHLFKTKIKESEKKFKDEKKKKEKEEIRLQVDREIFTKIIKEDRDAYHYEVNLLVEKMSELQKEKHELYLWAKQQQEKQLQEIRKLTRALGKTRKLFEDQETRGIMLMNETVKVQEQVQLTADILSTGGGESSEVKKENNTFLQDLLEKQEDKQDATINYSSKTGSEERIE